MQAAASTPQAAWPAGLLWRGRRGRTAKAARDSLTCALARRRRLVSWSRLRPSFVALFIHRQKVINPVNSFFQRRL